MTKQERAVLIAELNSKMVNSVEVMESYRSEEWIKNNDQESTRALINYEKGMIRGLERALDLINDLPEVMADYKRRKEV